MKTKKILFGMLYLLAMLSACTEEEQIDNGVESDMITFSFSTAGAEMKAGTPSPDPEELNVSECYVGVFQEKGNAGWVKVAARQLKSTDDNFEKEEASATFKVKGFRLPIAKKLKVVAIVNPRVNYANIETYAGLAQQNDLYPEGEVGLQKYTTFAPNSLIKVGETEITLDASSRIVPVSLKQLTAKIHLDLSFLLPESSMDSKKDEETGLAFGKYTKEEVIAFFSKNLNSVKEKDPILIKEVNGKLVGKLRSEWGDNDTYIQIASGYGDSESGQKYAVIGGATILKKSYKPSCMFKPSYVELLHIERQSSLLSPSGDTKSATMWNKRWEEGVHPEGLTRLIMQFYTYQKPQYQNPDENYPVTVNIVGALADGYEVTTKTYDVQKLRVKWGNGSGWGDGSSKFTTEVETSTEVGTPVVSSEIETTLAENQRYPAVITPAKLAGKEGDDLVYANYYDVTGRVIVNKNLDATLTWDIVVMGPVDVTVPDFN